MVAGRRKAELYGDFIDVSPEIDRQLSDSARITVSDISGLLEQEATAHKERKAKQLAAKNALEWLAGAELALACQEAK